MSDEQAAARALEDERFEQWIGNLLRYGVVLAALIGVLGGVMYLSQYRGPIADYRVFRGVTPELRSVRLIFSGALHGDAAALIQLGLLCLIATPIARVVLSLLAFARQRDWTYVAITAIVLGVLGYSLLAGHF